MSTAASSASTSSTSNDAPASTRIPNVFATVGDADGDDGDGDSARVAPTMEQTHSRIVDIRHSQERVAIREQNREGPPPDLAQIHVHGVGGDLGGVPSGVVGSASARGGSAGGGSSACSAEPKKQIRGCSGGGATSAQTPRDVKHWFRQQRRKHMAKLTPAQQERMKQNVLLQNREQRKHRLGRKAKKIAYASHSARSNVMSSIATYSAVNQHQSKVKQQAVRDCASAALVELQDLQADRLSASESEDDIANMDEEGEEAAAAIDEKQVKTLLDELRVEPKDEAEQAEKFKIYEQYLSIVTKSREECLKFHTICVGDLAEHDGVLRKMAASIKSIDSEANNSINWDNLGGRWFVYDMTNQSDRNNTFIGRIFTGLKRDLEMIQDNDMDCPICLENLTTVPSGVRVLHCCHKLCGECYDNWKMACQGGRVICPLCRQADFQSAVVTRTPAYVQQYLHDMASDSEESDDGEDGGAVATPSTR